MLSNNKRSVYVIQFRLFDEPPSPRNTRKFNIAERLFIKEKVGLVARYLIYAKGYAFMFNDERANSIVRYKKTTYGIEMLAHITISIPL